MSTKTKSFPCIICGRSLMSAVTGFAPQPNDGVMCSTTGNYGSTVFDSLGTERITFNICDPCFVEAGRKERLMLVKKKTNFGHVNDSFEYEPWQSMQVTENEGNCIED